jgi:hypothetical protein
VEIYLCGGAREENGVIANIETSMNEGGGSVTYLSTQDANVDMI